LCGVQIFDQNEVYLATFYTESDESTLFWGQYSPSVLKTVYFQVYTQKIGGIHTSIQVYFNRVETPNSTVVLVANIRP
jgi:hypothetical protein